MEPGAAGLARARPTTRPCDAAAMHAGTHCTISMKLPVALSDARMAASRHSTRLAIKAPSLGCWPLPRHKSDQPAKECAPAKKLDQSRLAPTIAAIARVTASQPIRRVLSVSLNTAQEYSLKSPAEPMVCGLSAGIRTRGPSSKICGLATRKSRSAGEICRQQAGRRRENRRRSIASEADRG